MNDEERKQFVDKLTKELADKGKLIELGWISFKLAVIPEDAPEIQLDEMRKAFFAGAQHLFASILSFLEPGVDPTEADLKRMQLINDELDEFIDELKKQTLQKRTLFTKFTVR